MVAVVVFEFSVMRCQPLRRALASERLESSKSKLNRSEKSAFSVQLAQVGFRVFLMLIWSNVLKVQWFQSR